jgi:hypothetical protein
MLIFVVTLFHELMHHLTKSVFNHQVLTHTSGVDNSLIVREARRELEEKLFVSVVCVIWNKGETAKMVKIQCLIPNY